MRGNSWESSDCSGASFLRNRRTDFWIWTRNHNLKTDRGVLHNASVFIVTQVTSSKIHHQPSFIEAMKQTAAETNKSFSLSWSSVHWEYLNMYVGQFSLKMWLFFGVWKTVRPLAPPWGSHVLYKWFSCLLQLYKLQKQTLKSPLRIILITISPQLFILALAFSTEMLA